MNRGQQLHRRVPHRSGFGSVGLFGLDTDAPPGHTIPVAAPCEARIANSCPETSASQGAAVFLRASMAAKAPNPRRARLAGSGAVEIVTVPEPVPTPNAASFMALFTAYTPGMNVASGGGFPA